MISDFQILGIDETDDLPGIKSAYRKRVKELHPDLSTVENAIERHDLFTAVCKAYKRLSEGRIQPVDRREKVPKHLSGSGIVLHPDQAYAFYKQGMKAFMAIHPSQWNIDSGRMLNTKIAGQDDKEQEQIRDKVLELVKLFPKAYYYFSIVAHEYPDSEWTYDAREKMGKIEERIGMYRKIIESFKVWNGSEQMKMKEYQARVGKMSDTLKAVRRDMPTDW